MGSGRWRRRIANTRYSALDQINTDNVSKLQVAWTFETGISKGHEAAPIIVRDTMYVVTPYVAVGADVELLRVGAGGKDFGQLHFLNVDDADAVAAAAFFWEEEREPSAAPRADLRGRFR